VLVACTSLHGLEQVKTLTQVAAGEPGLGVESQIESMTACDVQRSVTPRRPTKSVIGSLIRSKESAG
jgi:hypothetical protein